MKPRLRLLEAAPVELNGGLGFALTDPLRLSPGALTVNPPTLFVLTLLDGEHTLDEVRRGFGEQFHQPLDAEQLMSVVCALDESHLLAGDAFEAYYAAQVEAYRAAPTRPMLSAADLGLDHDTAAVLQRIIDGSPVQQAAHGRIVGLVAPHLDYPRGEPCYCAAYATLANRPPPRRVIILGTNHFGRSTAVAATGKDFSTPLGTTRCDMGLLARLEAQLGDLRRYEMDHRREHSIELQLLFCQQLWGADAFEMVALLCPDPCGPTGTAPLSGDGPDLRVFAELLGDCLRQDSVDTLVIAGADLSHVGPHFGDEGTLEDGFLQRVGQRDQAALQCLEDNDPPAFIAAIAKEDNPTRVCSAGCISALMFALPNARVRLLRYHQAVDPTRTVGVTCAAAVFEA